MYADDTVLYLPIDKKIPSETISNFQSDLNNFSAWCSNNRLSINENKTQIMLLGKISRSHDSPDMNNTLHLNNTYLKSTSLYKYLGITLNTSLNFTEHNSKIIRLVNLKINTLSHIRECINQCISLLIYKGTILPQMEYANILSPLYLQKDRNKFQRLQHRALRIIFPHSSHLNYEELHVLSRLSTLEARADCQIKCLMYRRAHFSSDFPTQSYTRHTRANEKIKFILPRPKLERFKKFPHYYGSLLWSDLNANTQKTPSYLHFKSLIKPRPTVSPGSIRWRLPPAPRCLFPISQFPIPDPEVYFSVGSIRRRLPSAPSPQSPLPSLLFKLHS